MVRTASSLSQLLNQVPRREFDALVWVPEQTELNPLFEIVWLASLLKSWLVGRNPSENNECIANP
jgi:hypothetical protein